MMCYHHWPALTAFCLFLNALEITCSVPGYPWLDHKTGKNVTCNRCPPGTFVAQPCTVDQQTVCQACPERHYTQYWHFLHQCLYCNVLCGENEVVKQECDATHNRVCECQPGYYLHFHFCRRHSACPPGSGISQMGTPHKDSQCETCRPGFFSSHSSPTEHCQPHKNCSAHNMEVNIPGNKDRDTICTKCQWHNISSLQEDDADCKNAILEFMAYLNIPVKHKRRLKKILKNNGVKLSRNQKGLHQKLQVLLLQLREDSSLEMILEELLDLLQEARLHRKIRKIIFSARKSPST